MEWIKPELYDFDKRPIVVLQCEDGYFFLGRIYQEREQIGLYWGLSQDYWRFPASDRGPEFYSRPYLPVISWIGLE